jgi:hypothetical protein
MPPRMTRTVALALLVLGCGTKEPVPAVSSTPSPARSAGSCGDRAAQLDKRLHELATATPGFLPVARDLTAPTSPSAKAFDQRGFVVAVAKDGTISVPAYRFARLEDLRNYLDEKSTDALEKNGLAGGTSKDVKLALYIWADRDTPIATVASVLATAAATSDHWLPRLVVTGTATTPANPAVAAKLPASEPDATRFLANQLRTAMGECKPMIMALATSTSEGLPQRETEQLAQGVPAGYAECNCTIPDARAFEEGIQAWFGAWAPPLAWVDMPKLDATDHQPIGKLVAK